VQVESVSAVFEAKLIEDWSCVHWVVFHIDRKVAIDICVVVVPEGDWSLQGIFLAAAYVFGEGESNLLIFKTPMFESMVDLQGVGILSVVVKSNWRRENKCSLRDGLTNAEGQQDFEQNFHISLQL
jgi:hypothetical protein